MVAFGLGTGKELSGAELSALTEAARAAQVREKAVELLSARPLSRKELVEKLTVRPRNREKEPLCGREAAEAAADWLEGLGYLDDGQYARAVAEHCAAKGYGPGRIREELYRRRAPLYEAMAQVTVDNNGTVEDTVDEIIKRVME